MTLFIRAISLALFATLLSCAQPREREPESPSPPGRFIDIHVHFHSVKPDALDPVAAWMKANDIRSVINLPLPQSLPKSDEERRQMLKNHAKYRGVIERFCIIEPDDVQSVEEAVAILEREKADGAIGFGEHYGRGLRFDDPKNMRLYAACAKVGLPVLFHIDQNKNMDDDRLGGLENVLKANPDCVLIAHAYFWRRYGNGSCERLLQKYPNFYAELSATAERSPVFRGDLSKGRDFVIRNADKLLFGSDAGWWTARMGMPPEFKLIDRLKLPPDVEDKLLRRNAEKLFPTLRPPRD